VRIGIFTVFIVVAIITMLESVISITPILFVQMGQEEAGAIDFKMTYSPSNLVSGDVNFYAVDPFVMNYTNLNYTYVNLTTPPVENVAPSAPMNKAKPLLKQIGPIPDADTFVTNEGDHYLVAGEIPVLNFDWYNQTLYNLPGFNGFTSRTIYPDSLFLNRDYPERNVTNILLIINSEWEQKIGLAPQFNPYILGFDEVMLGTSAAEYMEVTIGTVVNMEMNIGLGLDQAVNPQNVNLTPIQRTLGLLATAVDVGVS